MNDAHSWCTFIPKFTISVCQHIEKTQKKMKDIYIEQISIQKKERSCNDTDHLDDVIVIITLDHNAIFYFLTYTLTD
jgi:hypothetical protein